MLSPFSAIRHEMLRLFITFSSGFDKNLLEKWLKINDFGLDIIGREKEARRK